jgi:hypothetical protein
LFQQALLEVVAELVELHNQLLRLLEVHIQVLAEVMVVLVEEAIHPTQAVVVVLVGTLVMGALVHRPLVVLPQVLRVQVAVVAVVALLLLLAVVVV